MKINLAVAIVATGLLIACTQTNPNAKDVALKDISIDANERYETGESEAMEPPQFNQKNESQKNDPAPIPADWNKQIIRNAHISFNVKNAASVNRAVSEATSSYGGYIASATEVQLNNGIKHDVTIRVPREKFDDLLNRIAGYADSLLQKNISSQDVTAEYVDTQSRITAKEKVREQYYAFLKQAKNIDEVLKVQAGIGALQEEIETASGRVNYIRHQSALSTIQLSFFEAFPPLLEPPVTEPGFWRQVVTSAAEGWQMIQLLMIGLIKIWPLWIAAIIVWWRVRKRGFFNSGKAASTVK